MNAKDNKKSIAHLQKASDELQLALNTLYGEFVKPYSGLHKAWLVINKAIEWLESHA